MMGLGVREVVLALIVVLGLYLLLILFRLLWSGRRSSAEASARAPQTVVAESPQAPVQVPPQAPIQPPPPPVAVERPVVPQEAINELEIRQIQRELAQLRTEQDFLRSELVAMRVELNELQAVRERPPQYVHPVSPQHSEAMLLAERGIAAAQIAEHCGISVAEAELVCALARAGDGK